MQRIYIKHIYMFMGRFTLFQKQDDLLFCSFRLNDICEYNTSNGRFLTKRENNQSLSIAHISSKCSIRLPIYLTARIRPSNVVNVKPLGFLSFSENFYLSLYYLYKLIGIICSAGKKSSIIVYKSCFVKIGFSRGIYFFSANLQ